MRETFLIASGSGNMKFYAQKELDELYRNIKQTPYKKKNKWQKFLSDDASIMAKKRKWIRENEISLDTLDNY